MKYRNHILSILIGLGIILLAWQRLQVGEKRISIAAVVSDIVTTDSNVHQVYIRFNPKRHETHQVSFKLQEQPLFTIGDTILVAYRPSAMEDVQLVK